MDLKIFSEIQVLKILLFYSHFTITLTTSSSHLFEECFFISIDFLAQEIVFCAQPQLVKDTGADLHPVYALH